jgi:putative phage-type endonuclease
MSDLDIVHVVGSPEWVAARRRGLGASDVAAACGVSHWKSRFQLWEEKTGRAEPTRETRAMRVGTHLEKIIIEDWCEEHLAEIQGQQVTLPAQLAPCEIWATLDAFVVLPDGSEACLEAKHTNWRNRELGEDGTDQIPDEWVCQAQCQMAAAGVDRCYFAVWVDASTSREFIVERDDKLWQRLLAACNEFWRYVADDIVPPPEWANVPERMDRFLWLDDDVPPVDLRRTEAARLWVEYEQLGRDITAAQKHRETIKGEILLSLGDARRALVDDDKEVYVLRVDRKAYEVEASTYFQLRSRKAK